MWRGIKQADGVFVSIRACGQLLTDSRFCLIMSVASRRSSWTLAMESIAGGRGAGAPVEPAVVAVGDGRRPWTLLGTRAAYRRAAPGRGSGSGCGRGARRGGAPRREGERAEGEGGGERGGEKEGEAKKIV